MLYRFFNKHAYVTTLSSMLLCVPCFIFGRPELSLAFSIAIVGYWMGDTNTIKIQRQKYWLLLNLYLLICSSLIALAGTSVPIMVVVLGIIGFTFTALSAFGARSGTLGYGGLFLMTSLILLMEAGQTVWQATLELMIGGLSYHLCQTLADFLLPHQGEKEILKRAYATLGQKILMHAQPLKESVAKEQQFITTAHLRSQILDDLKILEDRLNYKNNEGRLKPRHAKLFHKLYTLKQMTRRSRLLTFVPSASFKTQCGTWLQDIHTASLNIAKLIQGKTAETPDFTALMQFKVPSKNQEEAQSAQEFIYHLQWILSQYQQTEIQNVQLPDHSKQTEQSQLPKYIETLRLLADWRSLTCRHAIRVSLCMSAGYYITEAYELQSYAWTLMTSILVLRPQLSLTMKRFRERLFGTVTGLLAFAVILLVDPSKISYEVLFFIATFGFYQFAIRNYGYAVYFITLMIFSGYMIINTEANLFLLRSANTALGILLPITMMLLVRQPRQYTSFQQQLENTLDSYMKLIQSMILEQPRAVVCQKLYDAVQKDAQLFNSWQLFLMEPKPKTKTAQHMLSFSMHSNQLLHKITAIQQNKDTNHVMLETSLSHLKSLREDVNEKPIFDYPVHLIESFENTHKGLP